MRSFIMIASLIAVMGSLGLPSAHAQDEPCLLTNLIDGAPLYAAPFVSPSQQIELLPVGDPLPVLAGRQGFYRVDLNGVQGWVDWRSAPHLDGNCASLPQDERSIFEFPTICAITLHRVTTAYSDHALTHLAPMAALDPGKYVTPQVTESARLIQLDHAMGVYVPLNVGTLSGACDALPPPADAVVRAAADARAWSLPDVYMGEVLLTLPQGAVVTVLAGPVSGPIRYDTGDVGTWYQVYFNGQIAGWVWVERLIFDTAPVPPDGAVTAVALDETRAWTAPDVLSGQVIAFIDPGTPVEIISEPVQGSIRYDRDIRGAWYLVRWGGSLTGWVWEGRLAID